MPVFTSIEKAPLDQEDFSATAQMQASTNDQTIVTKTLKFGKKAKIVGYYQSWDGALDSYITVHLNVNGNRLYPYESTQVQLAAIEADTYLPVPIEVPQGAVIRVSADSTLGVAKNATARVKVFYYDP